MAGDDSDCPYCFDYAAARAWGPKLPGLLSVLGSYTIIREVYVHNQRRKQRHLPTVAIPRILISMSVADIFFSTPYIFTTWAAPSEIVDLYQASGNWTTCTLQGASLQFGVSTSPFFHLAMSLCSLLIVRYNWSNQRIVRLEILLNVLIWSYGLIATIPFLFYDLYNPTSTVCWIVNYPHHCDREDNDVQCERGGNDETHIEFFRALFAFWPTWPCIILGIFFMIAIYTSVWQLETRNMRYAGQNTSAIVSTVVMSDEQRQQNRSTVLPNSDNASSNIAHSSLSSSGQRSSSRTRSRAVAIQAMCYTAGFLTTYSLDTVIILRSVVNLQSSQEFIVAAYVLFPLQGVFNIMVYMRTAKTMVTWEGKLWKRIVCGLLCCCCFVQRKISSSNATNLEQQQRMRNQSSRKDGKVEVEDSTASSQEDDVDPTLLRQECGVSDSIISDGQSSCCDPSLSMEEESVVEEDMVSRVSLKSDSNDSDNIPNVVVNDSVTTNDTGIYDFPTIDI